MFLLNHTSAELDTFGAAYNPAVGGPSVSIWTGVQTVGCRGARGIDIDMGYALGSQAQNGIYGPDVGWKIGFGFTDAFSTMPVASDTILFGAKFLYRTTLQPALCGIDFSALTFSDAILKTSFTKLIDGGLSFGGKQVVGQRQPAIPNATDLASAILSLNALLQSYRFHGLIEPS